MAGNKLTFLLKDIDRTFWGKVKAYVFKHDLTIREFILQSMKRALDDITDTQEEGKDG